MEVRIECEPIEVTMPGDKYRTFLPGAYCYFIDGVEVTREQAEKAIADLRGENS